MWAVPQCFRRGEALWGLLYVVALGLLVPAVAQVAGGTRSNSTDSDCEGRCTSAGIEIIVVVAVVLLAVVAILYF